MATLKLGSTTAISESGGLLSFPTDHIVKVVQTVKKNQFTSNGTDFTDITGLSANITPASGNKVLVLCTLNVGGQSGQRGGIRLVRDTTTDLLIADSAGSRVRSSFLFNPMNDVDAIGVCINFLDTPGANGSTQYTYKVQGFCEASSYIAVNSTYTDSDHSAHFRGTSQITLMEVTV